MSYAMKYCLSCLLLFALTVAARASISIDPKFLFLDGSRRSVSVSISNSDENEAEVWIEVKFGYETSDDSGKIFIHFDSLAIDEPSAATWIRCYPQRFIVGPGESQTVRIAVRPPAGTADGEYWARILVTSKPRNISRLPQSGTTPSAKPGVNVLTQLDLPFHFRLGKLSTGLEIVPLSPAVTDTAVLVPLRLTRTGNASFWGTRTIKVINGSGKTVFTVTKNIAVYKTMTLVEKISRTGLASGTYSVEFEFVTGKRLDVRTANLIQAPPIHTAASVLIP